MTATHPTDHELGDFLLGKLDGPVDALVESHLSECDPCRDRAVAVPAGDTLTELLAAARTRFDNERASDQTPTLDAAATPPAFAPTLALGESTAADGHAEAPAVLAAHPKYRVVRRLGIGGMGTVWLAQHTVMNRPVAVKVIRPDLLARPGATGRFLREVQSAAKLHHPNIVTAFDAEPAGDSCLLVMEYVPGETLGDRLAAGPLPVVESCRAIRDAARGLAHAHAAGLVHRDVKPHNLIRATDGTTKVLDFGLAGVGAGELVAADGDGLTGAGMVVGTPHYIAPEQVTDPHAADARADIYGLGCTLYHLLAGRPPFPDGSIAETLTAQQTREPDPIPGLAADLSAVLAKMLAKRPADRYQTADEVVTALERIIAITFSRDAKAERGRRPLRWLAIAAGLLLVTAAAVVFKIERDNQVITVATDDNDIEVVMKRKGELIRLQDKKTGQTWDLDTVRNRIGQADQEGGLTIDLPDLEPVVLRRNGKQVFSVSRAPRSTALPAMSDAARKELATWEGVWSVGPGSSKDVRRADRLNITGNRWSWEEHGGSLHVVEVGEKMTAVDFLTESGPAKGRRSYAILKRDGDTLHYCGTDFLPRPSEFKEQEAPLPYVCHVEWRRVRKPEPVVPAKPDRDLILGTWRGIAAELGGQPMPQQFIDTMKPTLTFTPDNVTGKPQGTVPKAFLDFAVMRGMLPKEAATVVEKGIEGVYHLDPTKSPRTIDIITLGEARKTGLGLYTLDGDTLKLCLSIDPVKVSERPTEFVSKAGVMQIVVTLRRLTPTELILEDIERRIDPAKGDGKGLPFALLERNGVAVVWFGRWRLAFEGVTCDAGGKVLFGVGSFSFPEAAGGGNFVDPGLKRPAPALGQQWNGRTNEIFLKNYRFEMEAKGARLVFADKTYEATDQVQTILIARDGTTRLEPGPKK